MPNAVQTTSIDAYFADVIPTLKGRLAVVVEALGKRDNFTNNELAHFLDWPINTITPRIMELRERKIVCEAERRPCKITGRTVIAWRLVCKGQATLPGLVVI